jgi:hypothetical protein
MDRRIWSIITKVIVKVNRRIQRCGRRPRYSDVLIARMYFWSVGHDRPLCWACHRQQYTTVFRPRCLPSRSQFCRRVRTSRIQAIIGAINEELTQRDRPAAVGYFDGKSLPVSSNTRDPDAKKGYADGSFRRGYKLHAFATEDGRIARFCVESMNTGEPNTARQLTDRIPAGCMVLADANYDSVKLYQAVRDRGAWLLTPLKGHAKSAQQLRYMPLARKWVLGLWQRRPKVCKEALRHRYQIERIFSALTCFGGGLSPLPGWVRRLERVRRWVAAKIVFYHARLLVRQATG